MSNETVSRRYALALADVVMKSGDVENVKSELKTWEQLFAQNPDLQDAIGNPVVAHASKVRVLESLLERTKPSKTTSNFLRILLRNGRLSELTHINDKFVSVLEERSGSVVANVSSARELSDSQQTELKINLEKITGKQIKLDFNVDPNLIGGVVTRIGSTIYDASVKTQLENLKEELIGS
jgi:F-type H+-transporting ATPase subunit delta